jgi:hypothetical protein
MQSFILKIILLAEVQNLFHNDNFLIHNFYFIIDISVVNILYVKNSLKISLN